MPRIVERLVRFLAGLAFALMGVVLIGVGIGLLVAEFAAAYSLIPFVLAAGALWFAQRLGKYDQAEKTRTPTGLHYEDFRFGDPLPTRKQFGYAMRLEVPIKNGMTKWDVSEAIDRALAKRR